VTPAEPLITVSSKLDKRKWNICTQ